MLRNNLILCSLLLLIILPYAIKAQQTVDPRITLLKQMIKNNKLNPEQAQAWLDNNTDITNQGKLNKAKAQINTVRAQEALADYQIQEAPVGTDQSRRAMYYEAQLYLLKAKAQNYRSPEGGAGGLNEKELSLYDYDGKAIAYIDTDNDDSTIYLWQGQPVAYILDSAIFSFNGKQLGWYKRGIIWDKEGYAAGFIKGAVSNARIKSEDFKGFKGFKPSKSFHEPKSIEPLYHNEWSNIPLEVLFSYP